MFANFIYLIVALLIYATYQPANLPDIDPVESLLLFVGLAAVFAYFCRYQYKRLIGRIGHDPFSRLDHRFHTLETRCAVMALGLFAVNIYGLNLPDLLKRLDLFSHVPTLGALVFLSVFILYLTIVWANAHAAYRRIYRSEVTRSAYVWSQLSFSLPILLPWLLLSGSADLINALPFEAPKQFLATPEGEIIFFLTFLALVAVFGPLLIQKFWRCKPLEAGIHRQRIESVCRRAGVNYADIRYWPIFGGRMITAGVMGLVGRYRYILVTEAMLRYLNGAEIDAVIAHEIGHVKRQHMLFYLVFFAGYMLFSFTVFDIIQYGFVLIDPLFELFTNPGPGQSALNSIFFSLVLICSFLFYFRYIFGFFMRNFERQADGFVYTLFDSAQPLITTLKKIAATSGMPADRPNWHHFSIKERIDFLDNCERDRAHVVQHDRKVKKSILTYAVGLMLVGMLGYSLGFGDLGAHLDVKWNEKLISKNCAALIEAYEAAYVQEPDSIEVLNNLAWFYATCEAPLSDPARALFLAQMAAERSSEPHVLDTLAESYYVNRMFGEAVRASQQALATARKNRFYYHDQLEKFKEAAGIK